MANSSDEQGDKGSDDAREELRRYLDKVNEELGKREEKMLALDAEVAQLEYKIKELRTNRVISSGDISSAGSLERFRSHLKSQLAHKKAAAQELGADVQRARDRREAVMKELKNLNLAEGEASGHGDGK